MTWGGVRRRLAGMSLRSRLLLPLVAMLVVLALNIAAAVLLARESQAVSARTESEVRLVQGRVDDLYRALVDQETGVRGYVITGQDLFLGPYWLGLAEETEQIRTLRSLLGDDPGSLAALERVEEGAQAWRRGSAEPEIRAVRLNDGSAQRIVLSGVGHTLFNDLRDRMQALETSVDQRSTIRLQEIQQAQDRTVWLLVTTMVVITALAVATIQVVTTSVTRPLTRLVDDVSRAAAGDLEHPVPTGGAPELGRLGTAVERMRARLLAERATAARRSLLRGQEEERRRLAMDIHDDTIQAVLAASLRLQRLRRHLVTTGGDGVDLLQGVEQDLGEATARLRRLIFELHPPTLDEEGLEAGLRLYLEETLDPAGIAWTLVVEGDVPRDPVSVALAYRVFREGILNVVRHSKAGRATVTVLGEGEEFEVRIEDDGVGFDPEAMKVPAPGHLGLLACRKLCEAAGGWWRVESSPGAGTRVAYGLPASVS